MSDSFAINIDQVRSHASTVDALSDRANTAGDAGAHVTSLDDAYGLFCQPFAQQLKEPQERGTEALKSTAKFLESTGNDLKDVAKSVQETEERIIDSMEKILKEIDGMSLKGER